MALKVYLIGRSVFDSEVFLRFLGENCLTWKRSEESSGTDELVEVSGRICYLSFGPSQSPKSNEEYIRHLIVQGHESVLEHASWTFLIDGISRACTHQIVRHRIGFSFSQLSQQYHDESNASFVEPHGIREFPNAFAIWHAALNTTQQAYRNIIEEIESNEELLDVAGTSREKLRAMRSIARSVLPNAAETKIVMTANARALRHFLKVRGTVPGDIEMRFLSAELLRHLKQESPAMFFDIDAEMSSDGIPIIVHSSEAYEATHVAHD